MSVPTNHPVCIFCQVLLLVRFLQAAVSNMAIPIRAAFGEIESHSVSETISCLCYSSQRKVDGMQDANEAQAELW